MFELAWTTTAEAHFESLRTDRSLSKRLKAVRKALRLLAENPRHPSLNTHEWKSEKCPHGGKLFEAYAENHTAGAYRIFFCYPPSMEVNSKTICIVAITPHP